MVPIRTAGILLIGAVIFIVLLIWHYHFQSKLFRQPPKKSLYDRLGGIYSIAAVVNHFSDSLITNPVVGQNSQNPQLRDWHRNHLDRLPGLKMMRTLWLADKAGGPFAFTSTTKGFSKAHCPFQVSSQEFDAVAAELKKSLDHFQVPSKEQGEVLAAFAAHKSDVIHSC